MRISGRSLLPWLIMVGLFAVTATYIIVAVPRTDAPRDSAPTPTPSPTSHSDGLTDRYGGYRLEPVALPTGRGEAVPVAFRILGPDGAPAARYAAVQTVPLHLYVVREDLTGYQHVHPSLAGDLWTTAVRVPDGGVYRLYAEFTPVDLAVGAHPIVLGTRFIITGDTTAFTLPEEASSATVGRFTVKRLDGLKPLTAGVATLMRFQVLDRGAPVLLEPYLGAFAHMSSFDLLSQGLTHLHPAIAQDAAPPGDATLTFHANFHHRGWQRLFLQFQIAGTVHLVAFTAAVS